MVGVPSDSEQPHLGSGVEPNKRQTIAGTEINNATLAYIHTHGVPELNIPARPFLEPGVAANRPRIEQRLRDAAAAGLAGNLDAVDRNLDAIGLETQAAVRLVITEGIPPPLARSTIDARRRRSKGSKYRRKAKSQLETTPLYDTGQLLHSISYVKREV
jgi:hypothetical protein